MNAFSVYEGSAVLTIESLDVVLNIIWFKVTKFYILSTECIMCFVRISKQAATITFYITN
jgi:hypothetical protein